MLHRFQRRLLYHPSPSEPGNWQFGHRRVVGTGNPSRQFLIFHGNMGCAADRLYLVGLLGDGVYYIHEYAGFGALYGTQPTKKAIIRRAYQAINSLQSPENLPLTVIGESLGSGVACEVITRLRIQPQALILITPYARMSEIAHRILPILGPLMLVDRYNCINHLQKFKGQVVIVAGTVDETIPINHAERLSAVSGGLLLKYPGGHNDAYAHLNSWLPMLRVELWLGLLGVRRST